MVEEQLQCGNVPAVPRFGRRGHCEPDPRDGFRRVIVVFGMDIDFNASHGPCWTAAAINKIPSVIIWTLLLKANGFRQVPRWFALPRFQSQW